jgi:hypothetical protein
VTSQDPKGYDWALCTSFNQKPCTTRFCLLSCSLLGSIFSLPLVQISCLGFPVHVVEDMSATRSWVIALVQPAMERSNQSLCNSLTLLMSSMDWVDQHGQMLALGPSKWGQSNKFTLLRLGTRLGSGKWDVGKELTGWGYGLHLGQERRRRKGHEQCLISPLFLFLCSERLNSPKQQILDVLFLPDKVPAIFSSSKKKMEWQP